MQIAVRMVDDIAVVELSGELNWASAPDVQRSVLEQARPEGKTVLDMSGVSYMASAGLRTLLSVYRTVSNQDGQILLVGLSENVKTTMELTGFLDFFTYCETLEAGIAQLRA